MNNDLISVAKLTELFSKKIDEERKTKLLWILAIVGAVAAVVVAAHLFISSLLLIIRELDFFYNAFTHLSFFQIFLLTMLSLFFIHKHLNSEVRQKTPTRIL